MARSEFLPFHRPLIEQDDIDEVVDTLRSGWITTGPKLARFERDFAEYVGAPAALGVSSGTAAMHIALAALGLGPGDEVVTTVLTFASTIHVIEQVGARPVLLDVEADTLNLDPAQLAEAADSGKVKAVMPVHLYGHPCSMDAIYEVAEHHGLAVIEDAAHSLPARYRGRTIGTTDPAHPSVVNLAAFSFYATKNLTTAEGGMLTGPQDVIEQARIWSLHGMSRDAYKRYTSEGSWQYDVVNAGFKYNLADLQAALGLRQLEKQERLLARRRAIVERYTRGLTEVPAIEPPTARPEVEHAWHIYAIRLNLERLSIDRARFIEELRARNIGTSVHFIPAHLHSHYRARYGYQPGDFPVALRQFQRIVSLPLYPAMSDSDVDDVISAVEDVATTYRR